jgi:phage terminase small subunit
MADKPLTPKQQRFVDEYLVDLNATAAYKRAGYRCKTDAVAASAASELLRFPKVAAALRAAQKARSERMEITQDYVVKRLKGEAELYGEGSSHAARVSALKLLGQHISMFPDRHEISGPKGQPLTFIEVRLKNVPDPAPVADRASHP